MKKEEEVNCWYCGKHRVTIIDYRTLNGVTSRYLSCEWCRGLNNKTIRQIQRDNLEPKDFYKRENLR